MTAIGNRPTDAEIAIRYSDDELFGLDATRLRNWAWKNRVSRKTKAVFFFCGYEKEDVLQHAALTIMNNRPPRSARISTVVVRSFLWAVWRLREHLRRKKRWGGRSQSQLSAMRLDDPTIPPWSPRVPLADEHDASLLMACLCERQANIISRSFGIGMNNQSLAEIAKTLGITGERVRQLEFIALNAMREDAVARTVADAILGRSTALPSVADHASEVVEKIREFKRAHDAKVRLRRKQKRVQSVELAGGA